MVLIQFCCLPCWPQGRRPPGCSSHPNSREEGLESSRSPVSLQMQQHAGEGLQRVFTANDTQDPDSDRGPVCATV